MAVFYIFRAVARIKARMQDQALSREPGRVARLATPPSFEAMWLILQQDQPDDFVIAPAEAHTVREFVELAFDRVGLDWQRHVEIDRVYFRPAEVESLCGDPAKAREKLVWKAKTSFEELVAVMVDGDVALLEDEIAGRTVRVDRDH